MVPPSGHSHPFDNASSNGGGQQPVTESGRLSPPDFSAEEVQFARALNHLYPLEQEELPPLFFQTIHAGRSDLMASITPKRRPARLGIALAVFLLILVALVPAFTLGLQQAMRQAQHQTPPTSRLILTAPALTQFLSPSEARKMLTFSPYWLGSTPAGYTFQALLLHMGQAWAKSPVVEVQYAQMDAGATYGWLTVREFQPGSESSALLIAPPGAVQSIQMNGRPAIAINGQWVHLRQGTVWESGKHIDVLYQDHGVIFWITIEQGENLSLRALSATVGVFAPLLLQTPDRHLPEYPLPSRVEVATALLQPAIGVEVGQRVVGASPETGAACYIVLGQPPDNS